jgi:glucosamine--fructose-6-phosphate aminotransferase (isomerizing)
MCGIYGYMGGRRAVSVCLEGLRRLEYRGYDSSGIAGVQGGRIVYCKEVGKVANLEKAAAAIGFDTPSAIAHTRWATHGKPSKENAHPHFDQNHTVAVIHNGIIENYAELREELILKHQIAFASETDTEVIAQRIGQFYQGDFLSSVQQALRSLEGSYAVAVIHKDHPDVMIAAAKESPLVVGVTPKADEIYLSSDPNALAGSEVDAYFLSHGEVALLKRGEQPLFFDHEGKPCSKRPIREKIAESAISKGEFEHFMLKEICEQPRTLQRALFNRFDETRVTAHFEEISSTPEAWKGVEHIEIVACGTSYHAACVGAHLLENIAKIPARADIASEYRYGHPVVETGTLVIAMSQSGETADTLAAMREARAKGARVLALCNVPDSTLAREADATLFLRAGPEIAVASTKTFTSQIAVLALFTLMLARLRNMSAEEAALYFKYLYDLPRQLDELLSDVVPIQRLAKKYASYEDFFFLGRSYLYPTALEAALKLKEIAYINATGYPAGEMKHGPIAFLSERVPVVIFCTNEELQQKTMSNLMESRARKAPIIACAWRNLEHELLPVADDILWVPKTCDEFVCIPLTVMMQLFAYYVAKERGTSIDQPRNLAKSVTVE